jgi:protein-disulfide isomerase
MGLFPKLPMTRRVAALALVLLLLAPLPVGAAPPLPVSADYVMGRPSAPVLVEEYASPACTHCAKFANEVFPAFRAKYIETGRVRYVIRPLLTPPEQVSAAGFLLARCAGPKGYYAVLEGFFRRQEEAYRTGDVRSALIAAAAEGGLDRSAYNDCVSDPKGQAALDAEMNRSIARGIQFTPTFYFNGVKLEVTEATLADLDAAYAAALKARRKP